MSFIDTSILEIHFRKMFNTSSHQHRIYVWGLNLSSSCVLQCEKLSTALKHTFYLTSGFYPFSTLTTVVHTQQKTKNCKRLVTASIFGDSYPFFYVFRAHILFCLHSRCI